MGKINVNPRNNYLSTMGILDLLESRVDQSLNQDSSPTFNNLSLTGSATVGLDLTVIGDLTVSGNTTVISTEIVEIKDNIIELNSSETGPGVTLGSAGIEVNRGLSIPYRIIFDETSDDTKIGFIGSLQSVATREDSPLNKGIMVYDTATKRIISTQNIELSTSFLSSEASVTSGTGAVRVLGGLGVVQGMSIDGAITFKGSSYSNSIDADSSNNLIFVAGNNMNFVVSTGNYISIPTNVSLSFDGGSSLKRIYTNASTLFIENTLGDISFNTISNGNINIPVNTYLKWADSNQIRYNGSNIVLDSTGNFTINTILNSASTINSTSSTTGAIITSGGIGAVKSIYIGDSLVISDQPITTTQNINEGVNLRSLSRTLTTTSTNNTTFNSLEGGTINTVQTIPLASTLYISSAPGVIGGGSLTNSYALYINSGESRFDDRLTIIDITPSSDVNTAALVLSGGISINNTTNASSFASGGNITLAGGLALAKDIYTGGKLDISAVATSEIQSINIGVNFRSRNRTLSTISTNNTTFNSFDGGDIATTVTIENASTVYIAGSPTISGGGSITNSYSMYINSGVVNFNDTSTSTSSSTGSLILAGSIGISNTTNAIDSTNGGSFTTAGGIAVAKTGYFGESVGVKNAKFTSNLNDLFLNANGDDVTIRNTNGSSSGEFVSSTTNFIFKNTSSATLFNINKTTGISSFTNGTISTSSTTGSLLLSGSIGISNTTNSVDATNGGTITTAGGIGVAKDVYIGGLLDVNGITNLDQVNINTNDGSFSITGTNAVNITVGTASNFTTTSGSITIDSQAGTLILDGNNGVTIDSLGSISIDAGGASNFSTTSGALTFSSTGLILNGNSGITNITGNGGINLLCTDTVNGIKIGEATPGIPIFIGNNVSETYINDNLTVYGDLTILGTTTTIDSAIVSIASNTFIVNSSPSGISDGAYLVRRYQIPNNTADGEVIKDTPQESSTFGANSVGVDQLTLNNSASAVDDYYIGWWILVTSGAGIDQVRRIRQYTGATKVALIYSDLNNNDDLDGLDLATGVSSGDSYELYDAAYAGFIFDESENKFKLAGIPFNVSSGEIQEPLTYFPIHVESFILQNPDIVYEGKVTIDVTNTEALLVRKDSDSGDVFNVDTSTGTIKMGNPINTVTSSIDLNLTQTNSVNGEEIYSKISSKISNNVSGNLRNDLIFSVQNDTEGLTQFLTLKGGISGSSFIDVSTSVDSLRILNTTASTSSTSGVLLLSGGIGISNTTNANSITNGGALTIAGGAAIAQSLFVGGASQFTNTTTITDTLNTLTSSSACFNLNGDLGLYNGTSSRIMFNNVGIGAPSFTNRSIGSKIILRGEVSGSSTDFAFGINTDVLWYSVPTSSDSHIFYNGTSQSVSILSTGVSTLQAGSSFTLNNGVNTSSIKENSNVTEFKPFTSSASEGFIFKDSSDTITRIRINSDGQLNIGLSGYSGTPSINGDFLNIQAQTFTDNVTAVSGTATINSFSSFSQGTLAATNASVTTTDSINLYIGGSPIRGTNQTITNAYGVYIDNGSALTATGTITNASSLYIKNAPTATGPGVITNAYSLFIDNGNSRFGGKILVTDSSLVLPDTSNDLSTSSGAINSFGDILLQNTTSQGIYFNPTGSAVPSFTNRSVGSKLILNPQISGSSGDYSIGIASSTLWYAVPTLSENHDFYHGTFRSTRLTSTGILLDSASIPFISPNTVDTSDNKGIIITGGGATGSLRGAQIEIYGNENGSSGFIELKGGASGEINLSTSDLERLTVLSSGETLIKSTTNSTGTGTGALQVSGGANVDLDLYVGNKLALDFNQVYEYTGDSSGRINVQSKTSAVNFVQRFFTNDGDNTDNLRLEICGLGTPASLVNTEYLTIGYASTLTYLIGTTSTGTGVTRPLQLFTGVNTNQLLLLADGTISTSSTVASTSATAASIVTSGGISINNSTNASSTTNGGALTVAGGAAITQDLYVGGNINFTGTLNLTTPSTVISLETNITGSVTTIESRNTANGNYRTFSMIFIMTPTSASTKTSFEFTVPEVVTNFANSYQLNANINGYYGVTPEAIENCACFAVTGTTRGKIQFTSSSTASHVIQLTVNYLII